MSTLAGKAYHPVNGSVEEMWEGFSWPCLLFGFLWYIYKGMWGWGVISFILAIFTWGISWLVFPFFANEQYAKSLLKRGYLNEKQWNKKNQSDINTSVHDELKTKTCPQCAEDVKYAAKICRFCRYEFKESPYFQNEAESILEKKDTPNFLEDRVLCSDGNCIGIINKDGICSRCGLTPSQSRLK